MSFNDLQLKVASEQAIITMHAAMAKLQDFVHDYTELEGRKGETIEIPVYDLSAPGAFDEASNNYGSGVNEVGEANISLNTHLVKSVSITDRQLQATDIDWLRNMTKAQTEIMGREINKTFFGQFTAANVPLSAEFDATSLDTMAQVYAICQENDINPADAVMILDPINFSKVLGKLDASAYSTTEAIKEGRVPGLFGLRGVVCSTFLPEGVNGVIARYNATGIVSRYLEPMSSAYDNCWRASDGDIAVIGFRVFANPATGRRYFASETLIGSKILDPKGVIRLIVPAT